jgi:hypothetical protein
MSDVKVEAGQRWRYKTTSGALVGRERLLLGQDNGQWRIHGTQETGMDEAYIRICCALVAPTPAAWQRWRLKNCRYADVASSDGLLYMAVLGDAYSPAKYTPIELAIWLLEQDAEYVGGPEAQEATPSGTAIKTSRAGSESTSWFLGGSALPAPSYAMEAWPWPPRSAPWSSERCSFSASPSRTPAPPSLPHEVPELYDGMRIRTCSTIYRLSTEDAGATWRLLYRGRPGSRRFSSDEARDRLRSGNWIWAPTSGERERATALAPAAPSQLHHLRALGEAVAALYRPARTRYPGDVAEAALREQRGVPFKAAMRAVMFATFPDEPPTPAQAMGVIAGCLAWEEERGRVAPGRRQLTPEQRYACEEHARSAIAPGGVWWPDTGDTYERARPLCRT